MGKIGNYRAFFLDYRNPGIFMITMNKLPYVPSFSKLYEDIRLPDPMERIKLNYSPVGFEIYNMLNAIKILSPKLELFQYVIMPDHVHFILNIKERLDQPLGNYMALMKRNIYISSRDKGLIPNNFNSIFEEGFNDQFLRADRSLDVLFKYVKRNPYRLWKKHEHPEFFSQIRQANICGRKCSLYGNLFLLSNPFKNAVVVHRRDSACDLQNKWQQWQYAILNGGLIVGAFIADKEKDVFKYALANEGKIILISNHIFGGRDNPHGELNKLCEEGRLLIISPEMNFAHIDKPVSRQECVYMNSLAEDLAASSLSF